jgi:hypothetical protein
MASNYINGVGRLVTDRYDFQRHVDGNAPYHKANIITLSPPITINSVEHTTVQGALTELAPFAITTPDASESSKGIVQLSGDLSGTATNVRVSASKLQGRPIIATGPATNDFLMWNGTYWTPSPIPFVTNINGASVPLATTASVNNVLCVQGVAPYVLQYKYLTNSNIDNAAAIAGTKISPNFGAQNIGTTGNAIFAGSTRMYGMYLEPLHCSSNTDLASYPNACLVLVDTTSVAFTVRLPTAGSMEPGRTIIFRDIGGNLSTENLTVDTHGSQLINAASEDKVLSADFGTWIFTSYGTGWYV